MDKPAFTLSVNFDVKCKECGTKGATESGYCLTCVSKNLVGKLRKQQAAERKGKA